MRLFRFGSIATVVLGLAAAALPAAAATFSLLYGFKDECCGDPHGRLLFRNGRLFGTGGADGRAGNYGQVFKLASSGGSWKETSPIIFDNTDGAMPWAGLISESGGLLFGTTSTGDANGSGNVFLLYKSGGSWTHRTLWTFPGRSGDGRNPFCDLIKDSSGNLYGTTVNGGNGGQGTVFELTQNLGIWTETVLYSFKGSDGAYPIAGLFMDGSGTIYGTTQSGGAYGNGTVFELTKSGGVWSETVLHSFGNGTDGSGPGSALIGNPKSGLYGTTLNGGAYGVGTVFEVFKSGGVWKENILHAFTGGSDGAQPLAGLASSGTGVLYGTAVGGGTVDLGNVFELTESGGVWSETQLYAFTGGSDGALPEGQVILDKFGALYGTASFGGAYNYGTVWKVVP
jgi:uncharacterized repeat protein (TIGR03803 family)